MADEELALELSAEALAAVAGGTGCLIDPLG